MKLTAYIDSIIEILCIMKVVYNIAQDLLYIT